MTEKTNKSPLQSSRNSVKEQPVATGFEALLRNAKHSTSEWSVISEERLPLSQRQAFKNVIILQGQYGKYARLNLKNGDYITITLDYLTSQICDVGDELMLSSLTLITLKKGEETCQRLAGRKRE